MCNKQHEQTDINICLAYAPISGKQYYKEVKVPLGTTIYEALQLVGWLTDDSNENIAFTQLKTWCDSVKYDEAPKAQTWFVGVYSNKKPLNYVLADDDRIEIYRTLTADPMNRRKNRAKK